MESVLTLDGLTRYHQALQSELELKTNKTDVATTASLGISNSTPIYAKISDFGNWGSGSWNKKGFVMLITSRAGETIWLSLSSNDSNTTARAIRLLNTYGKITNVYYSNSESSVYVKVNAWCNNVNAHILSNINGDYVPVVEKADELPQDATEVEIVEFGVQGDNLKIGSDIKNVVFVGSGEHPIYNNANILLSTDLPQAESWMFTLEDGTQITKQVCLYD